MRRFVWPGRDQSSSRISPRQYRRRGQVSHRPRIGHGTGAGMVCSCCDCGTAKGANCPRLGRRSFSSHHEPHPPLPHTHLQTRSFLYIASFSPSRPCHRHGFIIILIARTLRSSLSVIIARICFRSVLGPQSRRGARGLVQVCTHHLSSLRQRHSAFLAGLSSTSPKKSSHPLKEFVSRSSKR